MGKRDSSAFGSLLRDYRQAAGLSQEGLADRSGLSVRGISDLERGARTVPRLETVQRLANGLALQGEDRAALLAARNDLPVDAMEEAAPPRLPLPMTPLIGREREVAAIVDLLKSGEVRLITLVGPEGVGKTRLALAIAHWMAGHGDRDALFVDLAPVRDPALVLPTIAAVLGVQDTGP
ncbi:MAG TPA: helix-turn-helix domain-containing protein, partial [Chloroflexota bacterium]|nr:helix-turn-helix domain-containing protein [Chloroflexota bacterium]